MAWAAGIFSGLLGAGGSMAAGDKAEKGSSGALALQKQQYDQSRADLAPWRESGGLALNMLNQALGLEGYRTSEELAYTKYLKTKPEFKAAGKAPVSDFEKYAGMGPIGATLMAQADMGGGPEILGMSPANIPGPIKDIMGSKKKRARAQAAMNAKALADYEKSLAEWQVEADRLKGVSDTSLQGYDPAAAAEKLLSATPGYGFRMGEANKALERRQAAGGGAQLDPAGAKALTRFNQDFASNEWQNYLNGLRAQAGLGQTATNTGIQVGQNYAGNAGNIMVNAGNTAGGAILNAAGAVNQGVQGGLANYYTGNMYDKLLSSAGSTSPVYNDMSGRNYDPNSDVYIAD